MKKVIKKVVAKAPVKKTVAKKPMMKSGGAKKPLRIAQDGESVGPRATYTASSGYKSPERITKDKTIYQGPLNESESKAASKEMMSPAMQNYMRAPQQSNASYEANKQKKGGAIKPVMRGGGKVATVATASGVGSKKKMAVGGTSDSDCWPGNPGCNYNKAKRKNQRKAFLRKVGDKAGAIVGGILGAGAVVGGGIAASKLLKEKKGGIIKSKKK